MFKRFIVSLVAVYITLLCLKITFGGSDEKATTYTQAPDLRNYKTITVNGEHIATKPIIYDGQIYLPLRDICERAGYKIKHSKKSITATRGKTVVKINTEKSTATVKKKEYMMKNKIKLKLPPLLEPGVTYMNIDSMEKLFDLKTKLDREEWVISITYTDHEEIYISFDDGLGMNTIGFSYDDGYFQSSTQKYSPNLAQLSIALSAASHTPNAISTAYEKMGYSAKHFNYDKTNRKSSAFSIAKKDIKDKGRVYIISIRGTFGDEWYSNFDIYKDKNTPSPVHYGFKQGKDAILKELEKELGFETDKVKRYFLIAGHSRGGAIGNLLAAHLIKNTEYANENNVYAYTFATPNVSTEADEGIKNIYNFCNASDFITRIPFNGKEFDPYEKEWLYKKNGKTIMLDYSDIGQLSITMDMEQHFKLITKKNFIEIEKEKINRVLETLSKMLPDVESYYAKKVTIGEESMTVYDFFIKGLAASQLLGKEGEKGMLLIATGIFKGDMTEMSRFLAFNSTGAIDKNNDGTITEKRQGIKYNHSCEAYYAWIKAYNKAYY